MNQIELEQLPPEAFEGPDNTDDLFPFLFPTQKERRKNVPSVIAQRWSDSSHYWFFYNGFCDRDSIKRFLKAQPLSTLESIALGFDIEPIDLVSEKRRREGTTISKEDRMIIVEAILSSITT